MTYICHHDFHCIISYSNSCYYNQTDGLAHELCYGKIKYDSKKKTFIIIDRNRTMIYDSRVGFLDIKALSLKDELGSIEIDKLIADIKPLINRATDRNTIITDKYKFYFNKLPTSRGTKIQNDVLTKKASC